jgi:hypothetical protein
MIDREPIAKGERARRDLFDRCFENLRNYSDFDQFRDHVTLSITVFNPPHPRHAGFV